MFPNDLMDTIHTNSCIVTIVGMPPGLLMANPVNMTKSQSTKKVEYSLEEEADRLAYWSKDGSTLVVPARCIYAGLIASAAGLKLPSNKKKSLSPVIAGDISIAPDDIPLNTTRYEIMTTRCVNKTTRGGIIVSRPLVYPWELTFKVRWEAQSLGKEFDKYGLVELLEIFGKTLGLLSWRPSKKGPYGRFLIKNIQRSVAE